jgi:hypothetical protein
MPSKKILPIIEPPIPSHIFGNLMNPDSKGKCGSCGFLSRKIGDSPNIVYLEMEWSIRTGIQRLFKTETETKPSFPACFLHIIEPMEKIGMRATELTLVEKKPTSSSMQDVLWEDRKCPYWFSYAPGLSPERHLERYEMYRLAWLNMSAAQTSLRSTWLIGAFVLFLALVQIAEVWFLANRPQPQIIIQYESIKPPQQNQPSK